MVNNIFARYLRLHRHKPSTGAIQEKLILSYKMNATYA